VKRIALGISLGLTLAAFADSYVTFMKTQVAEFESVGREKCKEKTMEVVESASQMLRRSQIIERWQKKTFALCVSLDSK
jgi:hypothetical protein